MTDTRLNSLLEVGTLALIGLFSAVLAGLSIRKGDASGAAAWSAILMAIINTIKESRSSRTIDRMGQQLAAASPPSDGPAGTPSDPVAVKEVTP